MKLLEGKVALITGAGRGIGKGIALKFAEQGANLALTCTSLRDEVMKFENELNQMGVKAKFYAFDASDFEAAQKYVAEIAAEFGRIDILVNNAGITRDAALKRLTEEQWDDIMRVNLKSVFCMSKAVQPIMWKQAVGSIVNMSSVVGVHGNANQCNYAASKAGIIGFTKSAAQELGARNIRCNAIAPGFIMTEMTDVLPDAVKEEWMKKIPMRRGGTPEDVANVAAFLGSDLSAYVTGQVINVCGGMLT